MATLIDKGLEASIAKRSVPCGFARLMKAEGPKDVKGAKRSELADAVITNM